MVASTVRPDAAREAADEAQRRWEEAKKEAFSGASVSSTAQEAVHTQASFRDAASTGDVADADARRPLTFNEVVRQQTGVDPSCTKSAEQKREEDLEYRLMNNKLFRFATSLPFWWILSVVVVYSTLRNVRAILRWVGVASARCRLHRRPACAPCDHRSAVAADGCYFVWLVHWPHGASRMSWPGPLGFSAPKKVPSKDEKR